MEQAADWMIQKKAQKMCLCSWYECPHRNNALLLFDWDSLIVNFKNDTEKLFPSIYNKVNKVVKKNIPLTS